MESIKKFLKFIYLASRKSYIVIIWPISQEKMTQI